MPVWRSTTSNEKRHDPLQTGKPVPDSPNTLAVPPTARRSLFVQIERSEIDTVFLERAA